MKPLNEGPDAYFNDHKTGMEPEHKPDLKALEYERLCYEAFLASADGKALLEQFKERYHCAPLVDPYNPNAEKLALFFEGFREAFRGLEMAAKNHQTRILEYKG